MNQKARLAEMPAVILFGKDETSKPHASFFPESDLAGALNAAALMKMRVLRTDTDARRAVAADLPQGRVSAGRSIFSATTGAAASGPDLALPLEPLSDCRVRGALSRP